MSLHKAKYTSVTRERNEKYTELLQYANRKRLEGEFNDVTIQAGEQSISANRMVLSCYSKFFESMFLSSLKERYQDTVVIQQFDGQSIKILIEFIYTGTVDINTDNVTSLLSTADYLQIDEVKVFCFEFLAQTLTVGNCLEIWKISNLFNNPPALQQTYPYLCEHFFEIMQGEHFKTLSKNELNLLISKLDQSKVQEISMYKAILNWVQHDDNRKSEFPGLFDKIDLHKIPSEFVAQEVAEENLVKINSNCAISVMSYLASKVKCSNTKIDAGQNQLTSNSKNTNSIQSKILRIGGEGSKSVVEVYNVTGNSSMKYPDLPNKTSSHCSVKIDNFVFCIGGKIDSKATNKVYRMNLNETTLEWKEVASMIEKRSDFGAAVYDGNIVVAGGHDGRFKLKTVELYNVQANNWRMISSMKQKRCDHAVVAIRGAIFAVGGYLTNFVEQLDRLDGEWREIQSMNCFRAGFAAVYYNGFIYAIGGAGLHTVEKYDLANNKWIIVSSLNMGRWLHGACVLQDKIYVVGGKKNLFGDAAKLTECYNCSFDQWEIIEGADDYHVHHSLVAL